MNSLSQPRTKSRAIYRCARTPQPFAGQKRGNGQRHHSTVTGFLLLQENIQSRTLVDVFAPVTHSYLELLRCGASLREMRVCTETRGRAPPFLSSPITTSVSGMASSHTGRGSLCESSSSSKAFHTLIDDTEIEERRPTRRLIVSEQYIVGRCDRRKSVEMFACAFARWQTLFEPLRARSHHDYHARRV